MSLRKWFKPLLLTTVAPIFIVLAILPFREWLTTTDIVMLQLLWVAWVAVRQNATLAALTTLVSVACTDWFFVLPYFTFHIEKIEYLVTFVVMLLVGLMISKLAGELSKNIRDTQVHANNTRCLYELAKLLNGLDDINAQRKVFTTAIENHLGITLNWQENNEAGGEFFNVDQNTLWGGFTTQDQLSPEKRAFINTALSLLYQVHENTSLRNQSASMQVQAELERAKNALLRSLSHDLRTPLTTIMGASSMLADENIELSKALITEQARNIYDQSEILNQHFNKVMELSRVNKIGEQLVWQTIDVHTLVTEAKGRRQQQLSDFNLELIIDKAANCLGDITLLEIALANIFENAARYGDGVATVDFNIEQVNNKSNYKILVKNNIVTKQNSADEGVGLGSVICDVVAQFHHGEFSLSIDEQTQIATAILSWSDKND
ncbi:histidine kinase [Pseudoalteromonas sp. A601]|nr:histidine kinase [Pseudoalteromonas sp. A601]